MFFISIEDFYERAASCTKLSRKEEIECASKMKNGDYYAREQLVQSYLPMVAAHIKRVPSHMQSFRLILYCQNALEHAVDTFDVFQESESFAHRLSWYLRQTVAKYMTRN